MIDDVRRARDIELLDAIDAFPREPFAAKVWRVVREGRDPVLGSSSGSRWSNQSFDVLYTSLEKDGAIAEIYSLLSLQPVFPSKVQWNIVSINVSAMQILRLADLPTLGRLGGDIARYRDRMYGRTQDIADAAYFLGFDGLLVPCARWDCSNLVLFTDRIAPERIEIGDGPIARIDCDVWRRRTRA